MTTRVETLEQFVARFSQQVGCYYKENQANYSLKKYPSNVRGRMGVCGWVVERKLSDQFVISTYKHLADEQAIRDADKERVGAHYVPSNADSGQGTALYYWVCRGSAGKDFQSAVRALKKICDNR